MVWSIATACRPSMFKLRMINYPFVLLEDVKGIQANVCFNDQQALAVMLALKELNIRVPDDISIIGNDDIYYAKMYPILLTTIRARQQEIGIMAAEILIRNIESSTIIPIERVIIRDRIYCQTVL